VTINPKDIRAKYETLFIDGKFQASPGGLEDVINPVTGRAFGHAPVGTLEDAEKALAAARRAFDEGPWPHLDRNERADKMQLFLDKMIERQDEIIGLQMLEMGFTRMQVDFLVEIALMQTRRTIELARQDSIEQLPMLITPQADGTNLLGGGIIARDPIGVVAAITPYNAGWLLSIVKAVPAMAAGCTVICKPSPYTPLQTMLLAEMVSELDLPPGVFNVVTGGIDVGQKLGSDPRIDMVTFTGSDRVGQDIMLQAAPTLKKVHLELGGKSPLVVRRDADMALAVGAAIFGFVHQAGQGCSLTTRLIVDNRVRADFVASVVEGLKSLKIGDPFEVDTFMGPLIRDVACQRTEAFVQRALDDGADLVYGGKRPDYLKQGFFFEPTLFDNVANKSDLGQNEVFGPIGAVIGFDSDEEAVRLVNDSVFGLGGGIISRDLGTAMKMALKVRTGTIYVNGGAGAFHADAAFGGYGRSGLGRENGKWGFAEYSEIKTITYSAR
jgi:acyl-CoA reductase-like NAD-dependent aldehyde dehydrogenase